ncbi:hypothetical protein HMPREF9371_2295 [Neisseria shayeganii 871]|uniref:Uncharacterized protein n=1 Tax=Neisseria shayeganii 871 TaxID=1032488 RepID=G4CL04_9NEIS|nr:hypothetical protein HMPREF9371_2295 [Neisseria shayeganii 871]
MHPRHPLKTLPPLRLPESRQPIDDEKVLPCPVFSGSLSTLFYFFR